MEYKYLNILCEGPSEESFVKKVLAPYLEGFSVYTVPIILGGVSRYSKIRAVRHFFQICCCMSMKHSFFQMLRPFRAATE